MQIEAKGALGTGAKLGLPTQKVRSSGTECKCKNIVNLREEEIMRKASFGQFSKALGMLLVLAGVGAICAAVSFAQANVSAQLPNGPAKLGFDIQRFSSNSGIFKTFSVEQTEPLQKVLKDGRVAEDTPVLVTVTAAGNFALLTDQMVFHHLAQGHAGGKDWMAAF